MERLSTGVRCVDADPEMFFPPNVRAAVAAMRLCVTCPAQRACAETGLTLRDNPVMADTGVWGGLTSAARAAVHRGAVSLDEQLARCRAQVEAADCRAERATRAPDGPSPSERARAAAAVEEACLAVSGVSVDQLRRGRRDRGTVQVRTVVCWTLRTGAGWSLPAIGAYLQLHHTSVLAAVRRAEQALGDGEQEFTELVAAFGAAFDAGVPVAAPASGIAAVGAPALAEAA